MIYLISGSGEPNYGDDLILRLWIKFYRESGYKKEIFVDCKSIEGSIGVHQFDDNVYFGKFIKKLTTGRGFSADEYISRGYFLLENNSSFKGWNCKKVSKRFNLEKVEFVHLVGGGYISGDWNNSFSIFGAMQSFHEKYKKKVFATGLGLYPLAEKIPEFTIDRIRKIIEDCFSFFEVRDCESYVSLATKTSNNIINGFDDTFLCNIESLVDIKSDKSDRALHISAFKVQENDRFLSAIQKTMESVGFKEVFFWESNKKDIESLEVLKNCLRTKITVLQVKDLVNGNVKLNPLDVLITKRFHPHLICYRAGMTGIFDFGSEFYKNKHSSIINLGSPFLPIADCSKFNTNSRKNVDEMIEISRNKIKRILAERILMEGLQG